MQRGEFPYKNIGERIRKWRQRVHESVDDVSGALEVDRDYLARIENGTELPSEDVLLHLISHLDVGEKDATTILEQAGYVRAEPAFDEQLIKQMLMIIPFDNRILYSDSVNISASPSGVVFDFLQTPTSPGPATVGRIGMSLEQAHKMQQLLTEMLSKMGRPTKMLDQPKNRSKDD